MPEAEWMYSGALWVVWIPILLGAGLMYLHEKARDRPGPIGAVVRSLPAVAATAGSLLAVTFGVLFIRALIAGPEAPDLPEYQQRQNAVDAELRRYANTCFQYPIPAECERLTQQLRP